MNDPQNVGGSFYYMILAGTFLMKIYAIPVIPVIDDMKLCWSGNLPVISMIYFLPSASVESAISGGLIFLPPRILNPISVLSGSADPLQWDKSHAYDLRSGSRIPADPPGNRTSRGHIHKYALQTNIPPRPSHMPFLFYSHASWNRSYRDTSAS